MHLSPTVFRSDFAQSTLPSGQDISGWPRWAKRTLWALLDRFAIDPLIAPTLNTWRVELGLPPVSRILKSWFHSPQRVLGLFPEWFGDPQPDWPPQLRLTGFVLSDETCAPDRERRAADLDLEQFRTGACASGVHPRHGESTCPEILRCGNPGNGRDPPTRAVGDQLSGPLAGVASSAHASRELHVVRHSLSSCGGGRSSRRHRHLRSGLGCGSAAAGDADGIRSTRQRDAGHSTGCGQDDSAGSFHGGTCCYRVGSTTFDERSDGCL